MIKFYFVLHKILSFIICSLFFIIKTTSAQEIIKLNRTTNPPVIDGSLEEFFWQSSVSFSDFKTISPDYGLIPTEKTDVFISYDLDNLYIAIKCMDEDPSKIKVFLLNVILRTKQNAKIYCYILIIMFKCYL